MPSLATDELRVTPPGFNITRILVPGFAGEKKDVFTYVFVGLAAWTFSLGVFITFTDPSSNSGHTTIVWRCCVFPALTHLPASQGSKPRSPDRSAASPLYTVICASFTMSGAALERAQSESRPLCSGSRSRDPPGWRQAKALRLLQKVHSGLRSPLLVPQHLHQLMELPIVREHYCGQVADGPHAGESPFHYVIFMFFERKCEKFADFYL